MAAVRAWKQVQTWRKTLAIAFLVSSQSFTAGAIESGRQETRLYGLREHVPALAARLEKQTVAEPPAVLPATSNHTLSQQAHADRGITSGTQNSD